MIRYAMRCDKGHEFDGWFRSSDAWEKARKAGALSCTHCGSIRVEKAPMAPNIVSTREKPSLTAPRSEVEAALEKLRRHIEETSAYVGLSFAEEARAMHEGRRAPRAIHGEARPDEARKLIEDGVPVAPLPFLPRRKAN